MFKKVRDGYQIDDNHVEDLFKPKPKIQTLANSSAYGWLESKIPSLKLLTEDKAALVIMAFRNKYGDHHICPACESILLSHHSSRKCSSCGKEIKETKTVRQYLKDGDYK